MQTGFGAAFGYALSGIDFAIAKLETTLEVDDLCKTRDIDPHERQRIAEIVDDLRRARAEAVEAARAEAVA